MKRRLFLFVIFAAAVLTAHGRDNMIVEHFTTNDGLPHNTVYCAVKGSDGFMWFGTWYGLSSFDGVKFNMYDNSKGAAAYPPPRKIDRIVEDGNGYLWIKSVDMKLYVFDKRKETFAEIGDQLKDYSENRQIIKIEPTPEGDMLLLTKSKNLLRAATGNRGEVSISLLLDGERYINPLNSRLPHNVLGETATDVSWVGLDYKIISLRKGAALKSKPADFIKRKLTADPIYTAAYTDGRQLWLGDRKGRIYMIDPETGNVDRLGQPAPGKIECLLIARNKTIYTYVPGRGISKLDPARGPVQKIPIPTGLRITEIYEDGYDKLWFLADNGTLCYFDPLNDITRNFEFTPKASHEEFRVEDMPDKGLTFFYYAGDVLIFDRSNLTMSHIGDTDVAASSNPAPKLVCGGVLVDDNGIVWLSSISDGVFRINYPVEEFRVFNPRSLPGMSAGGDSPGVRAMLKSRNGDIWISTRSQEVYLINSSGELKQRFSAANYRIGSVYNIMEDSKGNVWLSTKGDGLVKARPDKSAPFGFRFTRYLHDPDNSMSISGNNVYFAFEDSHNRIWVGLMGGGLNLIDTSDGDVSFLHKYNRFAYYPSHGEYLNVRCVTEDKGRIWVGTTDGLISFDSKFENPGEIRFETYRKTGLQPNMAIRDIYVFYRDSRGEVWVGGFGGGLNKLCGYDNDQHAPVFEPLSIKEGLNNDVVKSITEDSNHNIWLATDAGVSRFDRESGRFRNFDKYDGLPAVNIEDGAVLPAIDGQIWFGCNEGILKFTPSRLRTANLKYKTCIVDLKISNEDVPIGGKDGILEESVRYTRSVVLRHDQSMITLEFAALNLYDQNNLYYRYQLEGYEKQWHESGKNRIASYSNLPPGKYVFRVEAMDQAIKGITSECALEITIRPPWWRTWWAYTLYFALAFAVSIGVVKFIYFIIKVKNDYYIKHKLSELKIRFFTNISHELRTPLTLISGPIQELKYNEALTSRGVQHVAMLEKNARNMLTLVNQILDFRKIQNGKMRLHVSQIDLNSIVESLYDEFTVMARENDMNYSLHKAKTRIILWADKEKFEIIIRNLISNAFKFTPCGGNIAVSVSASDDGNSCRVTVEDSGVGIPSGKLNDIFEDFYQVENSPGNGIGLALSKEMVGLHRGRIIVESKQNAGSVFSVEFLLGRDHFKGAEVDFYMGDHAGADFGLEQLDSPDEPEGDVAMADDNGLPTILIVEDNKDLCLLLKMQLEERFNIRVANNGVDGLKKIHLYQPDIVITDLMMPGEMDGFALLSAVRADFQVSHIPVIILTAKNDEQTKTKAITLGANSLINKPFSKDYLIARIEQLLSERRLFRERVWSGGSPAQQADNYDRFLVKKDAKLLDDIYRVIADNLDNSNFNIDAIASSVGLSRSVFFKKLKSLTGLAPVDLVRDIRLNKSLELIKTTAMSVSEIAFSVGFTDSGYYSKCFRKKYNRTPTDYINEVRKQAAGSVS